MYLMLFVRCSEAHVVRSFADRQPRLRRLSSPVDVALLLLGRRVLNSKVSFIDVVTIIKEWNLIPNLTGWAGLNFIEFNTNA